MHDDMNFVKLVGPEKAKEYLFEYKQKADNALDLFGAKAKELREFGNYLVSRMS